MYDCRIHYKHSNRQYIKFFEPNDLKLKFIVGSSKCLTRKLSQTKCLRESHVDVISLCTSIPDEFGMEALDHFFGYVSGTLSCKI